MLKKTFTNNMKMQDNGFNQLLKKEVSLPKLDIESQKKQLIEKSAIALKLRHFNSFKISGYNTKELVSDLTSIITPKDLIESDYNSCLRKFEKKILEKCKLFNSLSISKEKKPEVELKNISITNFPEINISTERVKDILGHNFKKLNELRKKETEDWSLLVKKNSMDYLRDKENHRIKQNELKQSLANTYSKQMDEKKEKDICYSKNDPIYIALQNSITKHNNDITLTDFNRKAQLREKLINIDKFRATFIEDKKKKEEEQVKEEKKRDREFIRKIAREIDNERLKLKGKKQQKKEDQEEAKIESEIKKKNIAEERKKEILLENEAESNNIFEKQGKYRDEIRQTIQNSFNFDTEKFHSKVTMMNKLKREYDEKRLNKLEVEYLEK